MGEFSETSVPEPEISMDVPDSEPVADIVEDTPPEAEPAPEIVEESPIDLSSVPETATDSSFDSESTGEETVDDMVDESSVDADSNMDTGFDLGLATEPAEDIAPESELVEEPFEASPEIPQEPNITSDPSGVDLYNSSSAERVFPGVEQTELYHNPETTREVEPGVGPNPTWDQPPDGSLNDHYPGETIGEDIRGPLNETDEGKVPPPEDLETAQDEIVEQSDGSTSDFRWEDVVEEESPPETLDALPQTEQTSLEGEATPEQSATPQVEQEAKPKYYIDGEEVTLPGDGELEYRIGSPHRDFEGYKGIVEAERQYDLASAAQTSDSLGEAVGTLAAASQEGTDFSEENEHFYGKHGHIPYTEAAYSQTNTDVSSLSESASDSQDPVIGETGSTADSELPQASVDTSSSTKSLNKTSDGSDSSNSSGAKNSKWSDEDQALLDSIQKARIEQEQELERELKEDIKPFDEPNPFDKPLTPEEQAQLERIHEARLHGHAVPATTLEIVDRAIAEHRVETYAEAQNKKNLPSEMRDTELKGVVQEANTSVHMQEKYTDSEVQVVQKDGSIRNLSADNPGAKYTIEYQGKLQKDRPDFIVRENSIDEETGISSSRIVEINDAKGYTRKDTKNPNASAESLTHMRQLDEATKYTNASGDGNIDVVFSLPEETARMQAVQDALAEKSQPERPVKVESVSSEAEISQMMDDMRHAPSERGRVPDEVFQEMERVQQLPVEERLLAWGTYLEKFEDDKGEPNVIRRNIREATTTSGDTITVDGRDGKKYTISLK